MRIMIEEFRFEAQTLFIEYFVQSRSWLHVISIKVGKQPKYKNSESQKETDTILHNEST